VLKVLVVSTVIVACYGFYQFAIQDYGPLFWVVNPRLDTGFSHGRFSFWPWRGRITSVLTSEMELGHYFNLAVPIGVLLWLAQIPRRSKWLLATGAILAGLLLTFTFGAWLALIATAFFFALMIQRKGRWKTILASTLIVSSLVSVVMFTSLKSPVEDKIY